MCVSGGGESGIGVQVISPNKNKRFHLSRDINNIVFIYVSDLRSDK